MSYILFGYLLVFLNIRINGFDIMPDFIGYLLIFAGVNKFRERNSYFSKARFWALFMGVVAFSDLLHLEIITIESELFMMLLVFVSVFFTVIPLYLMYVITRGIAELEWETGAYLGEDKLMQAWKINAIATFLLCILTAPLTGIFHIDSGMIFLMTVLMVCILLVNIAWVICFYGCKKRYDAAEEQLAAQQKENSVSAE